MVTKGLIFSWSRFRLACGPSKEQAASFVAEELAGDRGKADIGHQLMKARGVRFLARRQWNIVAKRSQKVLSSWCVDISMISRL